ncbi:MAG TPA: DNA-protecting protein DprA [Rhodospirillaceae bacterium]|nr:DNA-protecting protein DprA [Alphaproteobacteria bacterium]HBH26470.1 DNA-protecting protein DprA [Rhodospirillaceae bacterium]
MDEAERLAWLRLARTPTIGPVTFRQLVGAYGTAGAALEALPSLAARGGKRGFAPCPEAVAVKEVQAVARARGRLIALGEAGYPTPLAACEDAPPILAVLGDPAHLARPCVGIVGARNASLHGRRLAHAMARDLAEAGWCVVSGLARGIDTGAHTGALEAGATAAILAGGADVVYPRENAALYKTIREGGCVVAESPWGQRPMAQHFPKRNRIISGLSRGVIVVEATLRSGSLITARVAGEQGRDVLAVPGFPADPRAAGPNHLIRQGATLVRYAGDVLEALAEGAIPVRRGVAEPPQVPLVAMEEEPPQDLREAVWSALALAPVDIDGLVRDLGAPPGAVHIAVLELELAGRAQRLPGGRVNAVG